jgi:hypothetical protein
VESLTSSSPELTESCHCLLRGGFRRYSVLGLEFHEQERIRTAIVDSLIERSRVFYGVFFTDVESLSTYRANRLEDHQEPIFIDTGRSSATPDFAPENLVCRLVQRCHDVSIYPYLGPAQVVGTCHLVNELND